MANNTANFMVRLFRSRQELVPLFLRYSVTLDTSHVPLYLGCGGLEFKTPLEVGVFQPGNLQWVDVVMRLQIDSSSVNDTALLTFIECLC